MTSRYSPIGPAFKRLPRHLERDLADRRGLERRGEARVDAVAAQRAERGTRRHERLRIRHRRRQAFAICPPSRPPCRASAARVCGAAAASDARTCSRASAARAFNCCGRIGMIEHRFEESTDLHRPGTASAGRSGSVTASLERVRRVVSDSSGARAASPRAPASRSLPATARRRDR